MFAWIQSIGSYVVSGFRVATTFLGSVGGYVASGFKSVWGVLVSMGTKTLTTVGVVTPVTVVAAEAVPVALGATEVAAVTTAVAVATGWAWWWIPAAVAATGLVALLTTATVRVARRYYNGGTAAEEMAGVWNKVKATCGFPVEVVKDAGHLVAEGSRSTVRTAKKTGGWIAYPFKKVGGWAKSVWAWTRTNPEPYRAGEEAELVGEVLAAMAQLKDLEKVAGKGGILPAQA